MRVVLAGGGTGGHVIPALAIARELRERHGAEILFIGTSRGIENRLVPAAGFPLRLIEVGALKKVSLARRLKTLFALPWAVVLAWRLLREFRPDVVIGVGGYASGPGIMAAVLARIPTLVFEPNRVPGFANRVVARLVSAAAVHFEQTGTYFRNPHITGVPVRRDFFQIADRSPHPGDPPTLLICGGSQGARAVNRAMLQALGTITSAVPGLRIIHQTGERDFQAAKTEYQGATAASGLAVEVSPFIDDMPRAFAAASLIIGRSGASTVAEIAASGKPAIFIPFPHATDDHQRRNADVFAEAGAAVLIPEAELTPERLAGTVISLLQDPARLQRMGAASRSLSHPNAAGAIADIVAQLAGA
jgi:UDP-N-acetylglucosamine--N-acetylmuramyl-(pentapeptide) pyrophosphoryl-undecaprenol N-acetylglucosamine transferase